MRDKRFIAEHRGGFLKKEQQCQLILWACNCAENVLPLFGEKPDNRLTDALFTGKKWAKGELRVGEAVISSLEAHTVARESLNPVSIAVARAVGHAVAAAHMADHSITGSLYALKAVKNAGKSIDAERNWQNEQLPFEIRELVISTRQEKESHFKII